MYKTSSKICALLLVLALMPGTLEVVENLVHLVTEGHLAHLLVTEDHHESEGQEHGCTPIFHTCGCHASLSFLSCQGASSALLAATGSLDPSTPHPRMAGFQRSVDRPPRS